MAARAGWIVTADRGAMRCAGVTQPETAKRMGITRAKVSGMMRCEFSNLAERNLMDCLARMGYDVEIREQPANVAFSFLSLHS